MFNVSIANVDTADSYAVTHEACQQLSQGMTAVIGADESGARFIANSCDRDLVPYIATFHDVHSVAVTSSSVNLQPHISSMQKALLEFVLHAEWEEFGILYESDRSLHYFIPIIQEVELGRLKGVSFVLHKIRDLNATVAFVKRRRLNQCIVDLVDDSRIRIFLQLATDENVLTKYHHYMFTTLNMGLLNIGSLSRGSVNITGFSLVDPESVKARAIRALWNSQSSHVDTDRASFDDIILPANNALLLDAVGIVSAAVTLAMKHGHKVEPNPVSCYGNQTWEGGKLVQKFIKYILTSDEGFDGLSGNIRVGEDGLRKHFHLDLIEYGVDGELKKLGFWNDSGITVTKTVQNRQAEVAKDIKDRDLVVVTKLEEPFAMKRMSLDGNETEYYGYCIDLLNEVARQLNFNYTIKDVNTHGKMDSDGQWNGIVKQLMDRSADLAFADLTITHQRSHDIEFTIPFMHLGISILYKYEDPVKPSLFSFLDALHINIWLCLLGAFILVSITMYLLARLNPFEWFNPHPCTPRIQLLKNNFSLLNSFWFIVAAVMQQGCEIAPRAISTRTLAAFWYYFSLILISSYTANLAASLTSNRMKPPINNVDDLSKQTNIKYGCYNQGSTMAFFQTSKIPVFKKMWNFMSQNRDEVMVNSSKQGIEKVKDGGYAYLMESVPLRYQVAKDPNLVEVGDLLDSKGYGIGLPKNSPLVSNISHIILTLKEKQFLLQLYKKWWDVKRTNRADTALHGASVLDGAGEEAEDARLGMKNLGGVFVFLLGALALAVVIAHLEFFIDTIVNAKANKENAARVIVDECLIMADCRCPSVKPSRLATKTECDIERPIPMNGITSAYLRE